MNYQRVYGEFIADRRKKEHLLTSDFERHHIIARCRWPKGVSGIDAPENIIKLTRSDHLFAHCLLAKIHGGKLAVAFVRMLDRQKYRGRRSRLRYASLREEAANCMFTPEARKKMGAAASRTFKGKPRTLEARIKQGETRRARHQSVKRTCPASREAAAAQLAKFRATIEKPEAKRAWKERAVKQAAREKELGLTYRADSMRKLRENPQHLEWQKRANGPEQQLSRKQKIEALWQNPEYAKNQSEKQKAAWARRKSQQQSPEDGGRAGPP